MHAAMVGWVTFPFFSFFLYASVLCTCISMYVYMQVIKSALLHNYIEGTGDFGGVTGWLGYAVSLVLLGSGGYPTKH